MEIVKSTISYLSNDFGVPGKELIISLNGQSLIQQMIDISQSMQDAALQNGFNDDACQALFLFISEITNNALKARGSYELIMKYGSFENLFMQEKNPREIINKTISDYYPQTEIIAKWLLTHNKIFLEISNNTPLTDYFEKRINAAISKSPRISEELIEMLNKDDNILDTKASGIGMGLSMAVNFAALANGCLTYNKDKTGWTTFSLTLNIIA
jgi:hypothetical protein